MKLEAKCNVENCTDRHLAGGLCTKHYYRFKRSGSIDLRFNKPKKCTVNGCSKDQKCRGMCRAHYMRIRRNGTLSVSRIWDGKAKERSNKKTQDWKKKNWISYKEYLSNRKWRVLSATPPWVNKKEILEFYKERPNGFHVDHIVPLNGDNVCGLHVIWNLQYLLKIENLKKGNKLRF